MKFTIPEVPPSGNEFWRMHWSDRRKLITAWGLLVSGLAPKIKFDRFKLDATIFFKDKRRRDIPNYITALDKLVLDNLTRMDIIPDDDSRHMPEITVRLCVDKLNPRTEITLTTIV